jgi:hypothetical protein
MPKAGDRDQAPLTLVVFLVAFALTTIASAAPADAGGSPPHVFSIGGLDLATDGS